MTLNVAPQRYLNKQTWLDWEGQDKGTQCPQPGGRRKHRAAGNRDGGYGGSAGQWAVQEGRGTTQPPPFKR